MQNQDMENVDSSRKKIFEKKEKKTKDVLISYLRQSLALSIWIYIVTKLFVFDVDVYLMQRIFFGHEQILNYKFIIITATLALFLVIFRNKFLIWFSYIIFYPVIVFFWKIPYFVFRQKSWALAFAILNAIISFFKSLKYTFVSFALYIVAATIILFSTNKLFIWTALVIILVVILTTYVRRFIFIFKPSDIFQIYIKIFSAVRNWGTKTDKGVSFFGLGDDIRSIAVKEMSDAQLQSWSLKLQMSVLYNRICLFVGKKLREYQKSRLNIVYYVIHLLSLILLTIVSFALIYTGLFHINTSFFAYSNNPSFFTFIYFSFNSFIFN